MMEYRFFNATAFHLNRMAQCMQLFGMSYMSNTTVTHTHCWHQRGGSPSDSETKWVVIVLSPQ